MVAGLGVYNGWNSVVDNNTYKSIQATSLPHHRQASRAVSLFWRSGATQERALNPLSVAGQIEGGIAQGLGLAVMEEIVLIDGRIRNASFTDYLLPTMLDMPTVVATLIEEPDPHGTARGQGRGRATVHLVDTGDRGRDPRLRIRRETSSPGAGAPRGHLLGI